METLCAQRAENRRAASATVHRAHTGLFFVGGQFISRPVFHKYSPDPARHARVCNERSSLLEGAQPRMRDGEAGQHSLWCWLQRVSLFLVSAPASFLFRL